MLLRAVIFDSVCFDGCAVSPTDRSFLCRLLTCVLVELYLLSIVCSVWGMVTPNDDLRLFAVSCLLRWVP